MSILQNNQQLTPPKLINSKTHKLKSLYMHDDALIAGESRSTFICHTEDDMVVLGLGDLCKMLRLANGHAGRHHQDADQNDYGEHLDKREARTARPPRVVRGK